MSNTLNSILQQKLLEIQSQLPPFVKLVKNESTNFDEVLAEQVNGYNEANGSSRAALENINGNVTYNRDYNELIDYAAKKYNISSSIIKAVIKAESGFNPSAVSKAGAMGLMQLMPDTARSLGVEDAFNPVQNIEGGVKYLKEMLEKFGGNLELALAAYNAGPGSIIKYGGIPPYKETQNYVGKIMGYIKNASK